jgi:diguanylate cyclase (GGDEF)-like protein
MLSDPAATPVSDSPAEGTAEPVRTAEQVRLRFAEVDALSSAAQVATGCVVAAEAVLGEARLRVPATPIPLVEGSGSEELRLVVAFPAIDGEGELWGPVDAVAGEVEAALRAELGRIWAIQRERADRMREADQLKFHIAALQQVAHTLAVVRDVGETEQLAVDSTKEVFFAWWAALYRMDDAGAFTLRVGRTMRGETLPQELRAELVAAAPPARSGPTVPGLDAPIRTAFPTDLSVVAPVAIGGEASALLLLGSRMTDAPYTPGDLAILRAMADLSAIALRNADLMEQLRSQAVRDALTGCQNRRGFDEGFRAEAIRATRYGRPLSLVVLDIDHFKTINDTYGHGVGDHALRLLGRTLSGLFRVTDSVARIGGEEFAVVFPETPKQEAAALAERARLAIAAIAPDDVLPRGLTASLGVASYPEDGSDPEGLLRAADRALYRAKSGGRNRSELAQACDRNRTTTKESGE